MRMFQKFLVAAVASAALVSCGQCDKPKFDVKEYAKHKTERLDKIVDLSDAQEKEVYALYLEQGKEAKKNFKAFQKECANMKQPDCKKAECSKPINKAECKKAECNKACDKKAECNKAECNKACDKKAECKKAECNKPCDKKAECKKAECSNAPLQNKPKVQQHRHRPALVSPESKKATIEKIGKILTPEQNAKLKEHHAKRHAHRHDKRACAPNGCNNTNAPVQK